MGRWILGVCLVGAVALGVWSVSGRLPCTGEVPRRSLPPSPVPPVSSRDNPQPTAATSPTRQGGSGEQATQQAGAAARSTFTQPTTPSELSLLRMQYKQLPGYFSAVDIAYEDEPRNE